MATQLTSPVDAAIQQASQRLFQFLMARKDREIETRRLDISERGIAANEAQLDIQRRAASLQKAVTVSSILPPGASPADYPAVIPIFREAFPDLNPEDFQAFAQLPWENKTLQNAIDEGAIEMFEALPKDDPMRERMINLRAIGQASTQAQLGAQESSDLLRGEQAEVIREGIATIRNDPELARNAVLVGFGLQQEFEVPGLPHRFQTSTAASIFANLAMQRDEFGFRREMFDKEQEAVVTQDLAAEIMKLGDQVQAPLGRAAATQILKAYEASVDGEFEPGASPLDTLYEQSNPGMQRVIQGFIGAVDAGEDAWINAQPAPVQTYINFGRALGGKNGFLDRSETPEAMKHLVRQGLIEGLGFGRAPGTGFKRGITFKFETPQVEGSALTEEAMQLLGADSMSGISDDVLISQSKAIGITLTPEIIRRARSMVQNTVRPQDPDIQEAPPSGAAGEPAAVPAGAPGQAQLNMEDPLVKNLAIRITQYKSEIAEIQARMIETQNVLKKPSSRQRSPGQPHPEVALRRSLTNDQRRLKTLQNVVTSLEKAAARNRGTPR